MGPALPRIYELERFYPQGALGEVAQKPKLNATPLPRVFSMGHRFGPDLVCNGKGCYVHWSGHQSLRTRCFGGPARFEWKMRPRHSYGRVNTPLSRLCRASGIRPQDIANRGIGRRTAENHVAGKYVGPKTALRIEIIIHELIREKGGSRVDTAVLLPARAGGDG